MKVELLDVMGSVINGGQRCQSILCRESEEFGSRDKKLVRYLAAHGHWTPFAHVQVQLRIKAPVFVARQLVKHQVGLVWNEVSRRYVDFTPEFHAPEAWRKRAPDKKQGSLLETFEGRDEERFDEKYWDLMTRCETIYNNMLASGVAPEQARMVLTTVHDD
jgi:thymidylate synthase (FAD)